MAYRNYDTANGFIVDKTGNGDFTTISSAIAAASSGDTIFIRPGTYTENPNISSNLNITAYTGDDSNASVIIKGVITTSSGVTCSIDNIDLQNAAGSLVNITNSSTVYFNSCSFTITDNAVDAIIIASATATITVNLNNCFMSTTAAAINSWNVNSTGGTLVLNVYNLICTSAIAANFKGTAATQNISQSYLKGSITCAAGNTVNIYNTTINGNTTGSASCIIFTNNGATTSVVNSYKSSYIGNNATAPCVGLQALGGATTGFVSYGDSFITANTYAITVYSFASTSAYLTYAGASTEVILYNPSNLTVTPYLIDGGFYAGNQFSNTTAGCLGEQIRSYIASGSAITLTNNTPANVTSISLTAGIWDVSAIGAFSGTITGTQTTVSISSTSATLNTNTGDATVSSTSVPTVASDLMLTIPTFRVAISTTTTYYLVVNELFTVGTATAYGRISAVRTG